MLHLNTINGREALSALRSQLERSQVIAGQRARHLAKTMLATSITEHADFLARVQQAYGPAVAERLGLAFWLAELDCLTAAEQQEQT